MVLEYLILKSLQRLKIRFTNANIDGLGLDVSENA